MIVSPVDTLGTPWSARNSNIGDSGIDPLPFPAFMEPVVTSSSDAYSLDQDKHLAPEGSDLASKMSEDTKTVVDEVSFLFAALPFYPLTIFLPNLSSLLRRTSG